MAAGQGDGGTALHKHAWYWNKGGEPSRTVSIRLAESVELALRRLCPYGRTLNSYIAECVLPRFAKAEERRQERARRKWEKEQPAAEMRSLHACALRDNEIFDAIRLAQKLEAGGELNAEEREHVERVLKLTLPD